MAIQFSLYSHLHVKRQIRGFIHPNVIVPKEMQIGFIVVFLVAAEVLINHGQRVLAHITADNVDSVSVYQSGIASRLFLFRRVHARPHVARLRHRRRN